MQGPDKRRAVQVALQRRSGPSVEARAKIAAHFQAQSDLFSVCRRCGHRRTGSFEHVSGPCPKCVDE